MMFAQMLAFLQHPYMLLAAVFLGQPAVLLRMHWP